MSITVNGHNTDTSWRCIYQSGALQQNGWQIVLVVCAIYFSILLSSMRLHARQCYCCANCGQIYWKLKRTKIGCCCSLFFIFFFFSSPLLRAWALRVNNKAKYKMSANFNWIVYVTLCIAIYMHEFELRRKKKKKNDGQHENCELWWALAFYLLSH